MTLVYVLMSPTPVPAGGGGSMAVGLGVEWETSVQVYCSFDLVGVGGVVGRIVAVVLGDWGSITFAGTQCTSKVKYDLAF